MSVCGSWLVGGLQVLLTADRYLSLSHTHTHTHTHLQARRQVQELSQQLSATKAELAETTHEKHKWQEQAFQADGMANVSCVCDWATAEACFTGFRALRHEQQQHCKAHGGQAQRFCS